LLACPGGQVAGLAEDGVAAEEGEGAGLGLDDGADVAAGGDAGQQVRGVLEDRRLVVAGVAVGDAIEYAFGEVEQDVAVGVVLEVGL
jgi:hypothetical protein